MSKFKELGCEDIRKCAIAAMVYQDMQTSGKYTTLEEVYNPELKLIYFRCDNQEIVVPHNTCQSLNLLELEGIQRAVGVNDSVTIACCEPGSGVLYYSAHAGFKDKQTVVCD